MENLWIKEKNNKNWKNEDKWVKSAWKSVKGKFKLKIIIISLTWNIMWFLFGKSNIKHGISIKHNIYAIVVGCT